jgi:dephospho-CoA kinase
VVRRVHVIGLTGNIATGKTTVAAMLAELGAEVIDADRLVHHLQGPGSLLAGPLSAAFGPHVVNPDGSINRPALGQVVFSDPAKLDELERLIHPAVVERMRLATEEPGPPVLVLDAIKLIEAGIADFCDEVWVIDADRETQVARIMSRNDIGRSEAERRIDAQPPQSEKLARADVVIDNAGSLAATRAQVLAAWERLTSRDASPA